MLNSKTPLFLFLTLCFYLLVSQDSLGHTTCGPVIKLSPQDYFDKAQVVFVGKQLNQLDRLNKSNEILFENIMTIKSPSNHTVDHKPKVRIFRWDSLYYGPLLPIYGEYYFVGAVRVDYLQSYYLAKHEFCSYSPSALHIIAFLMFSLDYKYWPLTFVLLVGFVLLASFGFRLIKKSQ